MGTQAHNNRSSDDATTTTRMVTMMMRSSQIPNVVSPVRSSSVFLLFLFCLFASIIIVRGGTDDEFVRDEEDEATHGIRASSSNVALDDDSNESTQHTPHYGDSYHFKESNDQQQQLLAETQSLSTVAFQHVLVAIDGFSSRIIIPVYALLVVWYMLLLLAHPFLKKMRYYRRILSSLLSFLLPGIPIFVMDDVNDGDPVVTVTMDGMNHNNNNKVQLDKNVSTTAMGRNEQDQTVERQSHHPEEEEPDEEGQPIDMTGSYQMTHHENLDAFLSVQGVPWPLRRAASAVLPIHHIVHRGNQLSIQIVAQSSGFTTQTRYVINGPPVETNVRGRIFSDRVYYSYEDGDDASSQGRKCNGIITEKRAVTEGYIVTVLRKRVTITEENDTDTSHHNNSDENNHGNQNESLQPLPPTQQQIHMTSTVSFPNEPNKDPVICLQVFDRIK